MDKLDVLRFVDLMEARRKKMGKIDERIEKIQANPNLIDEQEAKMLKQLNKKKAKIVEQFNDKKSKMKKKMEMKAKRKVMKTETKDKKLR